MLIFEDRKYRIPRIWSNRELRKISSLFGGDVVNVSGWKDVDKEGGRYKDYFSNAKSYTITNYKREVKGMQGLENEIFLDLQNDLPVELESSFDVVFNHTVLEHVYDFRKAFENLCQLSRDIVIVVVPFLQEMHAEYGDFWRFTPLTMKNLFEENGLQVVYSSFNSHKNASVYLFFVGSKNPDKWKAINNEFSFTEKILPKDGFDGFVGSHAIDNKYYLLRRLFFGKLWK